MEDELERAMRENVNLSEYDDIPPSKSQWPGDESDPDSETEEEARESEFFQNFLDFTEILSASKFSS